MEKVKEKILAELYHKKDQYISGEELSDKYQVSRTAIWKHINSLKKEGYVIETAHKKGYRLVISSDKLIPQALESNLNTEKIGKKIIYFDTIDSTNTYSKGIARDVSHGTVIISEEQSKGRGRLGRDWSSPKGEGIWMSIILKPDIPPAEGMKMTQVAAAAVCKAIRNYTKLDALIKWPNDIILHGKKVCGILTEMAGELNKIEYLIIGIGINANVKEFPEALQDRATSLAIEKGMEINRQALIIEVLQTFEELYQDYIKQGNLQRTLTIVRNYSALLGKEIIVIKGSQKLKANVCGINDEGLLEVVYEDGKKELLLSGEVSIRGGNGYI